MTIDFRPRKTIRREEKQRLREAGAQAFRDGRSRHCGDHLGILDRIQWQTGYEYAEATEGPADARAE